MQVQIDAPELLDVRITFLDEAAGQTRPSVVVPRGESLTVASVSQRTAWLAAAVTDGPDVIAGGVFAVAAPSAALAHEADRGLVAVLADLDCAAVAWLSTSCSAWRPGIIPPRALEEANSVRGHRVDYPGCPQPTGFAGWSVLRRRGTSHEQVAQALAAVATATRGAIGRIEVLTPALAPGSLVGPESRWAPVVTAADEDGSPAAFAAKGLCLAVPGNYPIGIAAVADIRGDVVLLSAAIRGSWLGSNVVLIATDRVPSGAHAFTSPLAERLAQLRPERSHWSTAEVLEALRSPAGLGFAPSDVRWLEQCLRRVYMTVGELLARFAIAAAVGPAARLALERFGALVGGSGAFNTVLEQGLLWIRLAIDGWGASPLLPEFGRAGIVPSDLSLEVAARLRSRVTVLGAEVGVGVPGDGLLIDASPGAMPLGLRGLEDGRPPKTVVGVDRSLGCLGVDVASANGVLPWHRAAGTSGLVIPGETGGRHVTLDPTLREILGLERLTLPPTPGVTPLAWLVAAVWNGCRVRPMA